MSDTPSPTPESTPEATLKPKLTLTPKAPAPAPESAAPAPEPAAAHPAASAYAPPPILSSTPKVLTASNPSAPRASLKLQGPGGAKIETVNAPAFQSPMPVVADDSPSIAIVALSFIAAAAAITFAVLLYFKNQ